MTPVTALLVTSLLAVPTPVGRTPAASPTPAATPTAAASPTPAATPTAAASPTPAVGPTARRPVGGSAAPTAGGVAVAAAPVTWTTANSTATGDQDVPAIAANRNGRVAVVWEDDRDTTTPEDDVHSEIYLRVFNNGTPVYELKLSAGGTSGTNWKHVTPDVGIDDRGNVVVVWADDPDGNGFYNVPYRVVSPTGSVLASGRANASADGQQLYPKVAVDPDGAPNSTTAVGFSVVWEDVQGTAPATVRLAGYTNNITKAYEVQASQSTGEHHRPDVAVSASGDALVVWDEDGDANGSYNVGLARFARSNGAVNLSRRVANSATGGQQRRPAIAANFTGQFAVAWESDHTGTAGVWLRSFSSAAAARHNDVEVSTATVAVAPRVGLDDQANVVVGWTVATAAQDVAARGANPDGSFTGRLPGQVLGQTTTGRQEQIALTSSPWGEISVCYTDDNDGNSFDQIILGVDGSNSDW
ncbi:hypothetical protein [Plantactinospora sp. KLBMP9567]|uniref:hypothetical protein n=1 Tax=Plantactinospora sp. KLBMP9567 TaxID=3085900 RepID=UPI0029829FE1|nr:hypothetical protein [Plantactinospora sp. KLBMP9567]MDW5327433.1 hypothetical protein [Plantactinospora sp. KLBMP9567]